MDESSGENAGATDGAIDPFIDEVEANAAVVPFVESERGDADADDDPFVRRCLI